MSKVQEAKDLNKDTDPATDRRIMRTRQRAIGRELKRFYDGVVEEPVPDEFLALLHEIDEAGKDGKDG